MKILIIWIALILIVPTAYSQSDSTKGLIDSHLFTSSQVKEMLKMTIERDSCCYTTGKYMDAYNQMYIANENCNKSFNVLEYKYKKTKRIAFISTLTTIGLILFIVYL